MNGSLSNGHHKNGAHKPADVKMEDLVAGELFDAQYSCAPPLGCAWFSIVDMMKRCGLVLMLFYRCLLTQPISFTIFAYRYNKLWFGPVLGPLLVLLLPWWPFVSSAIELSKRLMKVFSSAEDWKMAGPGRIWFIAPPSLLASLLWDCFLAMQCYTGHYVLCKTDELAIEHTWYDAVCVKEFWNERLDAAGARRPMQLGHWDGKNLIEDGKGIGFGGADLVCKISDSYLGIGDRVYQRKVDFTEHAEVQNLLEVDVEYEGKQAVLSELVKPSTTVRATSEKFPNNVHQLDILTLKTKKGVRVCSVVLWTDCTGWSSHSATAGYLVDPITERIVSPTAWYAPYFTTQTGPLVGKYLPGTLEACKRAVAAHEKCADQPWLIAVGWDCMITDEGPMFFEGNVAAYRTPRRMFLSYAFMKGFFKEFCS